MSYLIKHLHTVTLTVLIGMLFTAITADASDEVLFEATYSGKYSGMNIKSTRTLFMTEDNHFYIESEMKNFFASIYERSDFDIDKGFLKPLTYKYRRSITGIKAREQLRFNWHTNIAEYRRKDKPHKNKDHPIKLGILDPALYQLQLQREAYQGKTEFDVTFVKPSKIKNLRFKATGQEDFTYKNQTYQALKIERINLDDDKQTRVWLIPSLNYQIARIEHVEEDGKAYNIFLTDYKSNSKLEAILYRAAPKNL